MMDLVASRELKFDPGWMIGAEEWRTLDGDDVRLLIGLLALYMTRI